MHNCKVLMGPSMRYVTVDGGGGQDFVTVWDSEVGKCRVKSREVFWSALNVVNTSKEKIKLFCI